MQREDLLDVLYRAQGGEDPKELVDELLEEEPSTASLLFENDANLYEVERLLQSGEITVTEADEYLSIWNSKNKIGIVRVGLRFAKLTK